MSTTQYPPLTESEYLRLEAQSPVRNEYWAGEVFAMTGGTLRHNLIAGNLYSRLRSQLKSSGCHAFISDVRVRIRKHSAFYYPDVVVTCEGTRSDMDLRATTIEQPILIIEVLSESTSVIDSREKLLAYRTLSSLSEYVLISQDRARVIVYRRNGDIGWKRIEHEGTGAIEFVSVAVRLAMTEIYEGVTLDPPVTKLDT